MLPEVRASVRPIVGGCPDPVRSGPRSYAVTREERRLDSQDAKLLIERAAAGDDVAWRELVDAFAPRVHALLVANCGDHDLAEEITQSSFCTVATKVGTYVEQGKFEAWLFRIAMNRLRDEMRRRKRQAIPVSAEVLRPVARTGREDRPRHQRLDSETTQALWEAVGGLAEADQQVLHLRHVAGLGFKEIAAQLEQPIGTVLARHFRALKRLREALGDDIAEEFAQRGQ